MNERRPLCLSAEVLRFERPGAPKRPAVVLLHGCDGWTQLTAYRCVAQSLVDQGYVAKRRLGRAGLFAVLHAAVRRDLDERAYMAAFVKTTKAVCLKTLKGIHPL